jgi:hypothetical protein
MTKQGEITLHMRSILIDWIGEVVVEYRLQPQTFFLSVNYIDRYLSREQIPRKILQLLGITCLFIASKLEETPPLIDDLLYICDNAHQRDEVN